MPFVEAKVSKAIDTRMTTLQNLLVIHNSILSEDLEKNGKALIDQTFGFIKDPKNKKVLATPEGADLLKRQVMLGNYLAVKAHFEKCIKNKDAKRQLQLRILDASLQSMRSGNTSFSSVSGCGALVPNVVNFQKFNGQVMDAMKKTITPDVRNTLSDTILTNSARALLNFKHKFDPNFNIDLKAIDQIAAQFPVKNKAELKRALGDYADKIKSSERKLSKDEILNSLNSSIEVLKNNKDQNQSVALREVQKPTGVLLFTSSMKGRTKAVTASDVDKIIKESETQIMNEKRDTYLEGTVEGLVKINPFATGEMLLAHPEYAGVVCDAINKVNVSDANKETRDRYFTIGSAILGGALLATAVIAGGVIAAPLVAAYVMTGTTATAVTATAATAAASSVLAFTTAASIVTGLGSALYQGNNAFQAHREMTQLENAFITNNGDAKNLTEAKRALEEFKENRTSAMISLVSSGLNFVNFSKLFSLAQLSSKAFKVKDLQATSGIMKVLADNKVALKFKELMAGLGDMAATKVDTFLYQLAKTGENTRVKILELLKNSRFTSKDLKEMVEDALKAAKNCV